MRMQGPELNFNEMLYYFSKIHFVKLGHRLLYSDAFSYANKHLTGEITVVMNADIALEPSWTELRKRHFDSGQKIFFFKSSNTKLVSNGL